MIACRPRRKGSLTMNIRLLVFACAIWVVMVLNLIELEAPIAADSPIEIRLSGSGPYATFLNRAHGENRIGYRFHEHTPITYGSVPQNYGQTDIDVQKSQHIENEYARRSNAAKHQREITGDGWVPQIWTFYLVPAPDGIDLLLAVTTRDAALSAYYGIQQCFRMSGATNEAWRHEIAKTPDFSEFDLWAEQEKRNEPKSSLTYVMRDGRWEPLPARKETVGARTPIGLRLDSDRSRGNLAAMPKVGPYDAEMLAPVDSGLIARVSRDRKWIAAIYWERTSHVTDHHPADCLHSIVNIGGIPSHSKRAVRGKIYWFRGTLDDLMAKWRHDFPRS